MSEDIFTKERLNNYYIEFLEKELKLKLALAINYIKDQVLTKVPKSTYQECNNKYIQIFTKHIYSVSKCKEENLDTILSRINEMFPDSKVAIDPLKTYILIDWS